MFPPNLRHVSVEVLLIAAVLYILYHVYRWSQERRRLTALRRCPQCQRVGGVATDWSASGRDWVLLAQLRCPACGATWTRSMKPADLGLPTQECERCGGMSLEAQGSDREYECVACGHRSPRIVHFY